MPIAEVLNSLPCVAMGLSEDKKILLVEGGCAGSFAGVNLREKVGQQYDVIGLPPNIVELLSSCMFQGEIVHGEFPHKECVYHVYGIPVHHFSAQHGCICVVAFALCYSPSEPEPLSSEEALNLLTPELTQAVSHEIRTPLTSLLGLIDLLVRDTELSDEQLDLVHSMQTSSQDIMDVLNQYIELLVLQGDQRAHKRIRLDEEVKLAVDNSSAPWVIESFIPTGLLVYGNRARFVRSLKMMLGACSTLMTDNGRKLVALIVGTNVVGDLVVHFEAVDLKVEVNQSMLKVFPKVTSYLHSSSDAKAWNQLALCKKILDCIRGEVSVQQLSPDCGLQICMSVAFASEQEVSPIEPIKQVEKVDLKEARVLVAEDNSINLALLVKMLQRIGFVDISTAPDGQTALDIFQSRCRLKIPFHIALLDHNMPKMNGDEAATKMRNFQPACLFICITANTALPPEVHQCFDGILLKPASLAQLREKLQSYLKESE